MADNKDISVWADWAGLNGPIKLGMLHIYAAADRTTFEFEYERDVLAHPHMLELVLDPDVNHYAGRQLPRQDADNFGVFLDSCPDRWGRLLMRRRLERDIRKGLAPVGQRLGEADYLLGVHDQFRAGGLRFRLDDTGPFLDDQIDRAAPPFVRLRQLEQASLAIEQDETNEAEEADEWLRMLIAPGGSLGGARPKSSVVDPQGHLWIAKFPSTRDDLDVGAWEMVVHVLAKGCGIRVPEAIVQRFSSAYHTFLVKRFDRDVAGQRVHFASAMTLTGHKDGDDATSGASYLELIKVLKKGAQPKADLRELWTRIVFNMCVSNTDDHLRNHGFLLEPMVGWRLSEACDMNPVPHGAGLKLNVSEVDNAKDLELALSVAKQFWLESEEAQSIVAQVKRVVSQWRRIATGLGIPRREQERMAPAFSLAG